MKIIELFIEDLELEQSGLDGIGLVNEPAIEENWLAFSSALENHSIITDPEVVEVIIELVKKYGQDEEDFIKEGWVLNKVEDITKENFSVKVISDPNASSQFDTPTTATRFKYIHPTGKSPKGYDPRPFCSQMIKENRVFRYEDILEMNEYYSSTDPEGKVIPRPKGTKPEIQNYRGGVNCRGTWKKLIYKKDERIVNKSTVRKGLISEQEIVNPYNGRENFTVEKTKFNLDDEKRIITGAAMIPNKYIVRRNPITGDLYYVFFSEETIEKLVQKYFKDNKIQRNNIEHTPIIIDGVYLFESWLVEDPKTDKSSKYGLEYPKGTWVVSMKVENEQVWKNIKDGKLNGFSIEGFFNEKLAFNKEDYLVSQITNIINNTKDE
jgi:hypothetical protein